MKIHKVFLLLFIIPLFSFTAHKFYLSLTQITYKSEAKSIQIIINVFMDDIETALNSDYDINLRLTSDKELKNNDVYFEQYLKQKLTFTVDETLKEFNYIGKEYDSDLVYFYLEIEEIPSFKTLKITNNILTNHFPTQQNMVKLKIDKKHSSRLLNKDENVGEFSN